MSIEIEWKCTDKSWAVPCSGATSVPYTGIADLLDSIRNAGWPICPECGADLDYEIKTERQKRQSHVIVEVEGGLVQACYAHEDDDATVEVLDMDRSEYEDEEEKKEYERKERRMREIEEDESWRVIY